MLNSQAILSDAEKERGEREERPGALETGYESSHARIHVLIDTPTSH